ncbi:MULTISPECIES: methionine adenosyltransferase domain-containing protein [unclassified Rhodosalinus]|uniref:methionine adenosyltransferase domain-containing protein n=1 Tax=unclassified Rhodosalinus TaxID=2630183 RepID=UPI003525107F
MRDFVMTSDSVTAGHPDKLCDRISDAVVDAWLCHGLRAGVAAECAVASGVVFLSVRSGAGAPVDPAAIARKVVAEAGYGDDAEDGDAPTVVLEMREDDTLSPDRVTEAVSRHMVTAFGYAVAGAPAAMPAPIEAAHRITAALDAARKDGRLPWLSPDAQAQVAVRHADRRAAEVTAIALNVALAEAMSHATVREALEAEIVGPALDGLGVGRMRDMRFSLTVHPGRGGPSAHSGLTGRKTGDDTYGAFIRHGGSALSGKDPSRVDRIAAYAARHAARAVTAAGLARECEVQLSYMPGDSAPHDLEVDSHGSGALPDAEIARRLARAIDFRVGAIQERFGLWELPGRHDGSFYQRLAAHGHMGRERLGAPWEDTDAAASLARG